MTGPSEEQLRKWRMDARLSQILGDKIPRMNAEPDFAAIILALLDHGDAAEADRAALAARLAKSVRNHTDLVSRLGFGDNITEPMADNDTIVAWFAERVREADEWRESQRWRDECYAAGHPEDQDCYEHDPARRLERAEARLAEVEGEVERLRGEHLAFTRALGFGDGVTEPAATLAQMVDPIEQAFSEASEYHEGPRICEPCGEWLATETCEHCHGSGCGPGTASGAYSECEWCAGVGKIHPGCVEQSYADLVAERDEARAAVARVEALAGYYERGCADNGFEVPSVIPQGVARRLRAALRGEAGEGRA
jgi:hypothetical protein